MAHCPSWLFIRDLQVPPSSEKTYNATQSILITIPFNYFSLDVHLYWLFIRDSRVPTIHRENLFLVEQICFMWHYVGVWSPQKAPSSPQLEDSQDLHFFLLLSAQPWGFKPSRGLSPPTTQSLPKPSILFVAQSWGFKPSKGLSTPQNSELRWTQHSFWRLLWDSFLALFNVTNFVSIL